MKKKKGFTLIELLLVFIILSMILTIGIISYSKINKQKKKQAWELVKNEIETAAINYAETNRYAFEGLSNKDVGRISVGTLVNEDYINIVTNPITGEAIDKCAMVYITKDGSKLIAKYNGSIEKDSTSGQCLTNNLVEIEELGAPSGNVVILDKNNNRLYNPSDTGWYNVSKLGENGKLLLCIEGNTNHNGPITTGKIGNHVVNRTGNNFCTELEDGVYTNIEMILVNAAGKKWKSIVGEIKKDTQSPQGNMTITSSERYPSNIVNTETNVKDNLSGVSKVNIKNINYTNFTTNNVINGYDKKIIINSIKISDSLDGNNYNANNLNAKVYDIAGNVGNITSGNYNVYKECTNTTSDISYGNYGKCSKTCGGGTKTRSKIITNKDEYTGTECSKSETTDTAVDCNTQVCKTTTTTKKTTTQTTTKRTTTKALCEDITITIPKWSGTKSYTVKASSSSNISKISSAYYEQKPNSSTGYTKNHEKSDSSKISQCQPPYYSCESGYTYLGVCSTNACGRQVCEYKQAGSTTQVRYFDNKKEK